MNDADIDDIIADEDEGKGWNTSANTRNADSLDEVMCSGIDGKDILDDRANDSSKERKQVGRVERFFNKLNVAAVHLTGSLRIGDTIEIDTADGPLRFTVSSMQIDRKNVSEAYEGDDVGIKLDRPVGAGCEVYVAEQ